MFLQIRSHAQKYFLKVQKNGTSEHVPPPRPKRKAAHPYPQKASKIGWFQLSWFSLIAFYLKISCDLSCYFALNYAAVSQATGPLQSSGALVETGYAKRPDLLSIPNIPVNSAPFPSWSYDVVPTDCLQHVSKGAYLLIVHGNPPLC